MKRIFRLLVAAMLLTGVSANAQTTLSEGDIAFIGLNTDNPDQFTFILLKDISSNTTIYFSDMGWDGTSWYFNTEDHLEWISTSAMSCGTVVFVEEDAGIADSFRVSHGTIFLHGSGWSVISGDQILAYQGTVFEDPNPTFIAGINMNDDFGLGNQNPTTLWAQTALYSAEESQLPAGLTNGTNALSLFPFGTELDNAKYTGSLTGSPATVIDSIMDLAKWSFDDTTPYDISAATGFTSTVSCAIPVSVSITSVTHVSCNGGSNGSVTATITPGVPTYIYSWSNGSTTSGTSSTTNTISSLTAGTYTVTVTDDNGSSATANVTIVEPSAVTVSIDSVTNNVCNGGTIGAVVASANGGTLPYTFSWSNSFSETNTPIFFQGFETSPFGTWNYSSSPAIYNTEGNVVVNGDEDVWAVIQEFTGDVTAQEGSRFWGGQDLNNPNGGGTGYHNLTLNAVNVSAYRDVKVSFWYNTIGLETADTIRYEVAFDNGFTWGVSPVQLEKNTDGWRQVVVDVPDGSTYVRMRLSAKQDGADDYFGWDNAQIFAARSKITNLAASAYTVTVTDANGCTVSDSDVVTQPSAINTTMTLDSTVSCNGLSDGGASASVVGGTPGYTYAWSNSATTSFITGVAAGTYRLTVTDNNSCTKVDSAIVTQPAVLTVTMVVDSNVSCSGLSDGGATAVPVGGTGPFSYSWSNSATTASITGVIAATYSVTVTDANGCTASNSVSITQPAVLISFLLSKTDVTTYGANDGTIKITGAGGSSPYNSLWSNAATTDSISNLAAGVYTVTITDGNSCTASASYTIDEAYPLRPGSGYCLDFDGTDDRVNLDQPAAFDGLNELTLEAWIYPDAGPGTAQSIFSTTDNSFAHFQFGSGAVTEVFTNAGTISIPMPAIAGLEWSHVALTVKSGETKLYLNGIEVASATDVYTSLVNPSSSAYIGDGPGFTSPMNGKVDEVRVWSKALTEGEIRDYLANKTVTNHPQYSSLRAYYRFDEGNGSTLLDVKFNNDGTLTNINTSTAWVLSGAAIGDDSRHDYSNPIAVGIAHADGDSVTAKNFSGSPAAAHVYLVNEAPNNITPPVGVNAFDNSRYFGTFVVGGTNPEFDLEYDYTGNANIDGQPGEPTVRLSVRDGNADQTWGNWSRTLNISSNLIKTHISQPHWEYIPAFGKDTLSISTTATNVTCNGFADGKVVVNIAGGLNPYSYSWSEGSTTLNTSSTKDSITGLAPNTYTVFVLDNFGDTISASAVVTQPTVLTVNASVTSNYNGQDIRCNGGADGSAMAAGAEGTPSYTYVWSSGSNTASASGLSDGTYTVTVTDGNNCTASTTVTLTEPTAVGTSFTSTQASCPGAADGKAKVTASGGTPTYTYSWSTGATTDSIVNVAGGDYYVTVTDFNNCTKVDTVTVGVIPDVTNPTISCPANRTEYVNNSCQFVLPNYTSLATANDNCDPSPVVTQSPVAGTVISADTTLITLTVTDASSNQATCTFNVILADTTDPVAICQNITVQLDANGQVTVPASAVNNNSTDNCGIASISLSPNTFNCSNVGGNSATLTVTDSSGNSSTCSTTITVQDTIKPTMSCQNVTVYLNNSGTASVTANAVDNGSTDNCSIASLSVSPNTFSCANTGGNSVTLTATDVNGNSNTCSATVTVLDTIKPVAICKNVTVQLNSSGVATITASQVNNNSTDNCSIASMSVSPNTFSCSDVGTNTVTLTVTDPSGNSSTCTATVTVQDNIAPSVACKNITVYLNGSGAVSITPGMVDNGSTDNCSVSTMTVTPNTFGCNNVGSNTVTLTVTDPSGNSSSCSAAVTVRDTVPPVAMCKNATIYLGTNGQATLTAAQVDNNSTDNCGISSRSVSKTTFSCSNVGTNNVTLLLIDMYANVSSCSAVVTVVDTIKPTANCKNIVVQLDANGNASITAANVNNNSTDNCGIAGMSVSPNTFNCSNVGNNTVTLTVTDVNGNVSTCTSTVTVQDNIKPDAICQNITAYLNSNGQVSITGSQINNGSTDNCSVNTFTVFPNAFTCNDVGTFPVIMTATDVNGNTDTCGAIITIADTVKPVAICKNITAYLNALGQVTITANNVNNGSTDNCSIGSMSVSPNSFTCANLGANTVTLTVTDIHGNSSTCTSTVTVADTVPPVVACKNISVYLNSSGQASIAANALDNGSTDNCALGVFSVAQSNFTCSDVGANNIVLTVNDANGNSSTCTSVVTVIDTVKPVVACKNITVQLNSSGTAAISATDIDNGSADNCSIATMTVFPNSFTCSDVGNNTVTLTVTDVNGNTNSCTATVTVQDTVKPNAVCQPYTVYFDAFGQATVTALNIDGSSTDNCSISNQSVAPNTFGCNNTGANTVTLTVTDVNGNSNFCTTTVTVVDTTKPWVVCQPYTAVLDPSGNVTITPQNVDLSSNDNCGIANMSLSRTTFSCADLGPQSVTLIVTDNSGNTDSCITTVTVVDNTAPTLQIANVTAYLNEQGFVVPDENDIVVALDDNCPAPFIVFDPDTLFCNHLGTTSVAVNAIDGSGNVTTFNSTVTVMDTVSPVFNCPSDTIVCTTNPAGSVVVFADPVATDNCGSVTVTQIGGSASGSFFPTGTHTITYQADDGHGNITDCIFNIIVNPVPVVALGNDTTICDTASLTLQVASASDIESVLWSDNSIGFSITLTAQGEHWVVVTDTLGCVTTDTINLTVVANDCPWPIGIAENRQLNGLSIYPNPTMGKVFIEYHAMDDLDYIGITNLNGRVIEERYFNNTKLNGSPVELNIADFAPGMYMVSVRTKSGRVGYEKLVLYRP